MSILIEGVEDAAFRKALDEIGTFAHVKNHDIVFFGVEAAGGLQRLRALRRSINQDGAVWVVYPKGARSIRQHDVTAA